jgi:signal transduction histidine kinase
VADDTRGRGRWPRFRVPALVAVVLAAAVAAAFVIVRSAVDDQNDRILEGRTGEVALLLKAAVGDLSDSMRPLGVASRLGGPSSPEFVEEAHALTAAAPTRTVALVRRHGTRFTVVSAAGPGLAPGDALSGAPAAVAARALTSSRLVSTPVFRAGPQRLIAFALGPPVTSPGTAIYLQVPIDPSAAAEAPVTQQRPFEELAVALYATPQVDPRQLIVTTGPVPRHGQVAYRSIAVGGRRWLLAARARKPLVGSFAAAVPWITLGVGLSSGVVAISVILLLQRRRDYALALVDARTAELEASLRELEQTQARLVFQERLATIGQVAAAVGHELRNPLGVLTNALYLVRSAVPDDGRGNERLERNLQTAEREIGAMAVIVETMLDFAREREPVMEPMDLADLVDEALSVAPPPSGVEVVRVGLDEIPLVEGDRQQLRQVLLNLFTNAYEAMAGDGVLTIEASQNRDHLDVSVSDTGTGMDDETAKQVFDPFFTRKVKGIGLGMAVTKRIVEAHNGTITTETTPGLGTTFRVTIPNARVAERVRS